MSDGNPGLELPRSTPFHEQWQRKHKVWYADGWTNAGFDPTVSPWTRDVQLFAAMTIGKNDIENGGFHQFFGNSTGMFAPEMVEYCNRAGLGDAAEIITDAMRMLGEPYPRDRSVRQSILAEIPNAGPGRNWDPFDTLNERFFNELSRNAPKYDNATDEWLRVECGVTSLTDTPPVRG